MDILAWICLVLSGLSFVFVVLVALQLNVFYGTIALAVGAVPVFYYVSNLFLSIPENIVFIFAIIVGVFNIFTFIKTLFERNKGTGTKVFTLILTLPHLTYCTINVLNYLSII